MFFIAFNFPAPIIDPGKFFYNPLQFFVAFWCVALLTGYLYPKLLSTTTRIRLPWWLYLVSCIVAILIRYSIGLLLIEFLVLSLLTYFWSVIDGFPITRLRLV